MASLCKRQQCTVDRRGFRQELDSWRRKLLHCVGFESILEGLFGPELVQDLQLFKDREPLVVSDWSFDENCVFCCLRRDKVKEHLSGSKSEGLEDPPKPLLAKDQTSLLKLERQAEEFLSAVLRRKDVPNFSDPHVPVVAREILQRMIRQFASEYTSKASAQDPPDPQASSELPSAQAASPLSPLSPLSTAHNLNPVLSKLLMIDQDAPLDLTVRKPPLELAEQDGVLDLSLKKNRSSCVTPHRSLSLTPVLKGEPREVPINKVKELQAASKLERFMYKLCLHHQRQIVTAIRFLQAEVKALTPCKSPQPVRSPYELQQSSCSPVLPRPATPTKTKPEPPKPHSNPDHLRLNLSSCAKLKLPVMNVPHSSGSGFTPTLSSVAHASTPTPPPEAKHSGQADHAPLKLKIMKTGGVSTGNKLSCVLTTSLSLQSEGNLSSNPAEAPSARLGSASKKHVPNNTPPSRQPLAQTEDRADKPISVLATTLSNTRRTARKSIRPSSEEQHNEYNNRIVLDPDIGHCDIIYINKPITECFKKHHRGLVPRRNARKSTRGHMFADDIWEIKTVRTLAGRGNCPNPLLEFNTSHTPKQNLSKPEGLPPVDMPCAGEGGEASDQQSTAQESAESRSPNSEQAVETPAADAEIIVETSQTDQSQLVEEAVCPSHVKTAENPDGFVELEASAELAETSQSPDEFSQVSKVVEKEMPKITDDTEQPALSEVASESVEDSAPEETFTPDLQKHSDAEKDNEAESEKDIVIEQIETPELVDHVIDKLEPVTDSVIENNSKPESVTDAVKEKTDEPQSVADSFTEKGDEPETVEVAVIERGNKPASSDSSEIIEESETQSEVKEISIKKGVQDVMKSENNKSQTNKLTETQTSVEIEQASTELQPKEKTVTDKETSKADSSESPQCSNKKKSDPLSTTLKEWSKELSPRRKNKASTTPAPKEVENTEEVVVGFVSGKAVLASDRSLRRRSGVIAPPKEPPTKRSRKSQNEGCEKSNTEPTKSLSMEQEPVPEKVNPSPSVLPAPEKSPDKQTIPEPKLSARQSKAKKKKIVRDSMPSTRQLRSSGQVPVESPTIAPVSAPTAATEPAVKSKPLKTESKPDSSKPLQTESKPDSSKPLQTESNPDSSVPVESSSIPIMAPTNDQTCSQTAITPAAPETSPVSKTDKQTSESTDSRPHSEDSVVCSKPELRSSKVLTEMSRSEDIDCGQVMSPECPPRSEPQSQAMSLRSKRVLKNETEPTKLSAAQKPTVDSQDTQVESLPSAGTNDPVTEKPTRMPLRSESSKTEPSAPADDQKLWLRSQRRTPVADRLTDFSSPIRMTKISTPFSNTTASTSTKKSFSSKSEAPKRASAKFLEALNRVENQQFIANLNLKYDKMQKGWLQLDKEGQPTPRYRNKADRQAAIWKSKRRARKSKTVENPKYSPVQMLFIKDFELSSISRWFLETTETKSLVIVKKVNTRLPSETQLCFHSCGAAGSSQDIYPSVQAERLKKHLKKFAISSPVKSNPKSQKLIAKALELESVGAGKGKEKKEKEVPIASVKKECTPTKRGSPKLKGSKPQNPASARILRKYSNIREKMQVQHANARLKDKTKVKVNLKSLSKGSSKSEMKLLKSKSHQEKKQEDSVPKPDKKKALAEKSSEEKSIKSPKVKAVKSQGGKQVAKEEVKKELPKRSSQRLCPPPASEPVVAEAPKKKPPEETDPPVTAAPKNKADKNTADTAKSAKVKTTKVQKEKESSEEAKGKSSTNVETTGSSEVPTVPDQVQTRSQRKSDATAAVPATPPKSVSKKSAKGARSAAPAEEPARTRSEALKLSGKRSQSATLPRTAAKKAQELIETPAKRTRSK